MSNKSKTPENIQKLLDYITVYSNNGFARVKNLSVPGKEISLAHVIGSSQKEIYSNLGLDIGFHAGEDHTGESIGILRISPPESCVIAADIAVKAGDVDLGFMDRFSGALILLGSRSDVTEAITQCVEYFHNVLHYNTCRITTQ